ncbi:hypothetical protein HPY42_06445 [Coprothermobacteraceae bacterium]|nr:hypothetical protein [Coprothermobacteraceae bacterium]
MEKYLEKTIRALQSVIEALLHAAESPQSRLARKPALVILVWLVVLVVANISSDWRVFISLFVLASLVGLLLKLRVGRLLVASLTATLWFGGTVGLLYLVFGSAALSFAQRLQGALLLPLRTLFSVLLTLMLVQLLGWSGFTRGLRSLGIPALLTLTVDMAVRYIHLLSENALNMMLSRKSRVFCVDPPHSRQFVGASAAFLWLKSYDMSEQVYQAMAARGFDIEGGA